MFNLEAATSNSFLPPFLVPSYCHNPRLLPPIFVQWRYSTRLSAIPFPLSSSSFKEQKKKKKKNWQMFAFLLLFLSNTRHWATLFSFRGGISYFNRSRLQIDSEDEEDGAMCIAARIFKRISSRVESSTCTTRWNAPPPSSLELARSITTTTSTTMQRCSRIFLMTIAACVCQVECETRCCCIPLDPINVSTGNLRQGYDVHHHPIAQTSIEMMNCHQILMLDSIRFICNAHFKELSNDAETFSQRIQRNYTKCLSQSFWTEGDE